MQQAWAYCKIPPKIYSFIIKKANEKTKKNGKKQKHVTKSPFFTSRHQKTRLFVNFRFHLIFLPYSILRDGSHKKGKKSPF